MGPPINDRYGIDLALIVSNPLDDPKHDAVNGALVQPTVDCVFRGIGQRFAASARPFAATRLSATDETGNVGAMSRPKTHDPIASRQTIAAGVVVSALLALTVSMQTYLGMLAHGHSFRRIFLWQLAGWSFWAIAAPFVLRWGAAVAQRRSRSWVDALRVLGYGVALTAAHGLLTAQLTLWFQPFDPIVTFNFRQAFVSLIPYGLAIDIVVYGTLLVGGGALFAQRRAHHLELRESKLEAELARAELRALRLEIEPHFLFNTLNSIAALIRLKDNARALEMLVGLGDFMRGNLEDARDQFAPLSTEIDWVKRYVALQQTRFGDRLRVDYEVAADCLEVAVPTLLLQPIVENALRHGAARHAGPCRVVVGAAVKQRRLTLWITDDGAGLPANFDLNKQTGTGLRNTRSRLEHLYGADASIELKSRAPSGTTVSIALPIRAQWEGKATA